MLVGDDVDGRRSGGRSRPLASSTSVSTTVDSFILDIIGRIGAYKVLLLMLVGIGLVVKVVLDDEDIHLGSRWQLVAQLREVLLPLLVLALPE